MQPAQVGSQAKHDAFEEQGCVGILFLSHHRAARFLQAAQQVAALRVNEADRVGEPALRGGDELHVELGQVGPRPAHVRHPCRHPLLAGGSEAVRLAIGPLGFADPLGDRPERPGQASSQLVPVGRLVRQHGQHDFLPHAPTSRNR